MMFKMFHLSFVMPLFEPQFSSIFLTLNYPCEEMEMFKYVPPQ